MRSQEINVENGRNGVLGLRNEIYIKRESLASHPSRFTMLVDSILLPVSFSFDQNDIDAP